MRFDLTGYNIDNLLKTLYTKKVPIKNISRPEYNHVVFDVDDKFEKKVKRYVANYKGPKSETLKKKIPKLLITQIGVILGVFVGFIMYFYLSSFTWQIEIYGTKELKKEDVVRVLKDNGVRTGKIIHLTNQEIESILLNNYDRIAQVSVIKQGTAIMINLSEKLVYENTSFEPICATNSGIINSINVVTGTVNVKVGDFVNAGDILVLPFNLNSKGEKVNVCPEAEIRATMYLSSKVEVTKIETIYVRSGKKRIIYDYQFMNHHCFFGKNKNSFALFDLVVYNENVSNIVPLSRIVNVYYELVPTEITHDFETEKQEIEKKSKDNALSMLTNGEILDEKTESIITADKMIAITTITVDGIIND